MPYRLVADLVVLFHLAFVVFALFGGLLALKWKRIVWLQAPAALWAAAIEFGGWICPLTPLEIWLRGQGGETGYRSGFIEYYLLPVLYPADLTREMQFVLGAAVLTVNIAGYAWLWHRWRKPV